jgi:hypothetical protein
MNQAILDQVFDWGKAFQGFKYSHASDGLAIAQSYVYGAQDKSRAHVEGLGVKNEHSLFLLAINVAWLIWLDDRFDSYDINISDSVDWMNMVKSDDRSTPETQSFSALRVRLAQENNHGAALQLWVDAAADVFLAYQRNKLMSRSRKLWSYAEYLHYGESSIAVMYCVSMIALVYDLRMSARMHDKKLSCMLKNLSLAMRLQNDLVSFEKERAEGDFANAVLIMEKYLPQSQAVAFVAEQKEGYEALLARDLDALGPNDPFSRIAKIMLATLDQFYRTPRERYAAAH